MKSYYVVRAYYNCRDDEAMKNKTVCLSLVGFVLVLAGCGDLEESPRLEVPMGVEASGIIPVTTNFGYEVTLTAARVAAQNFSFAVAGEVDTAFLQQLRNLFIARAYAHPGHFQGGEVTGEMTGQFILDWFDTSNSNLGLATMIAGQYTSSNFVFGRASEEYGVLPDDPLYGHTALLIGEAVSDSINIEFTIIIDSPIDRELLGIPFEVDIGTVSDSQIGLRLLTKDGFGGESSLFDDIDFGELDAEGGGQVTITPESEGPASVAYDRFRRKFQTHDYFDIQVNQNRETLH